MFVIIRERLQKKEPVVLVTVIESTGSTPRGPGAMMLVGRDHSNTCKWPGDQTRGPGAARLWGSIGGGIPEHKAIQEAADIFHDTGEGRSAAPACSRNYILRPDNAADIGAKCGGELTVFFRALDPAEPGLFDLVEKVIACFSGQRAAWLIFAISKEKLTISNEQLAMSNDRLLPSGQIKNEELAVGLALDDGSRFFAGDGPRDINALLRPTPVCHDDGEKRWFSAPLIPGGVVYVFGGGHVAQELVPLLARLDFRCVVFDDREEFTKPELFHGAVKTILGDFACIGDKITLTEKDYAVIITRGHVWDLEAWAFALDSPAAYIGVIGSKSKHEFLRGKLKERGFGEDRINAARVRAPIGLDIKSKTPAEIAVSIAGELILVRADMAEPARQL